MSIYKKINGKDKKVADNSVIDHSQLTGRESLNAHPISAIRKLPEKLTILKSKLQKIGDNAKQISLTDNNDGTLTFKNFEGATNPVKAGHLVDNTTIKEINNNSTLEVIGIKGTFEKVINDEPTDITKVYDAEDIYDDIESAKGISLTKGQNGTLNFTDYLGNVTPVQGGHLLDEETIELQEIDGQDKLVAVALQTEQGNLSGERIREIITSKGGYLDSYNFNTVNPTQDELTEYAIQQIGNHAFVFLGINITQEEYDSYRYIYTYDSVQEEYIRSNSYSYDDAYYVLNIWDKTRVINLFTNNTHPNPDTWSWDTNSEFWSNLGFIGTITDGNNDGLHGLVTGSDADYKVSINGDGTMSVNDLPELAQTVDTMIVNEHTNAQDKVYSAQYIDNNYAPLSFVSKLYFQKDTSTTATLVNNSPAISSSNYLTSSTTDTDFDWNNPIFTTTRVFQSSTILNKENSFTIHLNFNIDRDANISFGAKIRISQDNGST